MIDFKKYQSIGLTPGKAILIVVLLIIFVGVMISNFMPTSTPAPTARENFNRDTSVQQVAHARRKSKSNKRNKRKKKPTLPSLKVKDWPKIDLEQAIAHDPFELPQELRPPKKEKPKIVKTAAPQTRDPKLDIELLRQRQLQARREKLETLKALQESGAGIALVTAQEQWITYGNKKLRVGDRWEGFRIIEIRPDGSVVVDIE